MTDKLIKIADYTILAILAALTAFSLFFPSYLKPGYAVIYKCAIVIAGFIFIMSSKLLKEELKIDTPIDGYLFALFIWTIASSLFSRSLFASFNAAVTFAIYLLFFYVVYNYAKKHFTRILIFLAVCSVLLGLYGLYQYYFGFEETLKYLGSMTSENLWAMRERLETRRVFSTFIYPNTFAGFLILMIPVLLGLFKSEKKYRPYLGAALALLVFNLILTKSVGAFISLITGTFIVLLLVSDPSLVTFRRLFMMLLAVCVGLLLLVLKMRGFSMFGHGVQAKLESYLKMADIVQKFILTGAGPGNFEMIYNNPAFGKSGYLKYAHNFMFQAAVEMGLVGLCLFIAAGFKAYSSIIQNFYFIRTPRRKVLVFSLLTGITAFLIHNLVDFDIYIFEVTIVFLILLAALLSQINIGMIQLKKVKLSYLLGLSPGKRRSIIFYCVMSVLALCAITGGRQVYVLSLINVIIAAGFAILTVSKENIRRTSIDFPIILMMGWLGFSLLFTPDLYEGLKYFSMALAAAALYFLSSQFLRRLQFRISMVNFIIITGAALSVAAGGQYLYRYFTGAYPYADAFFPNQNLFAGYMAIPFSLLLSKLLLEKNPRMPWAKSSLLLLFAVSAGLAYSKSGILTFIFAFCACWLYYRAFREKVKDNPGAVKLKNFIMSAGLLTLLLMAFGGITPSGSKLTAVKQDPFYFNRLDIWKASAKMAADKPVLGYGIGSFEKVFPSYNFPIKAIARYQKETPFAHNELLQAAAATGITGLLLMLYLIFSLMRSVPAYEGHRKLWAASAGSYVAVACVLFHSLFYFTLHVPGMLYTVAILASMITVEKYSLKTVPKEALLFTKIYYFPALLFAFIIFSFAVRPAAGEFLYSRYRHTGNYDFLRQASLAEPFNSVYPFEKGLYFEKNGNFRSAAPFFEASLKTDGLNYISRLHLARAYSALDDRAEALTNYNLALKANPFRAFTYSEMADFYLSKFEDITTAEALLVKALAAEPDYLEARANLAVIYRHEKKYAQALAEYDIIESALKTLVPLNSYEEAIVKIPAGAVFGNKALLLMELGRKKEAYAYYTKSILSGAPYNNMLDNYCGRPVKK